MHTANLRAIIMVVSNYCEIMHSGKERRGWADHVLWMMPLILKITASVFHFFPSSRTKNEHNEAGLCNHLLEIVVFKARLTGRKSKVTWLSTVHPLSLKHTLKLSLGHNSAFTLRTHPFKMSILYCGRPLGLIILTVRFTELWSKNRWRQFLTYNNLSNFDASCSFFCNGFHCHKLLNTDSPTFLRFVCLFTVLLKTYDCIFLQTFYEIMSYT